MKTPRVFISYSWTSPEHVAWVVDLAKRLAQDGVEVTLDQWDLKEGQDKHAFMETMVNDEGITRVLVISDSRYADRADSREGGVGTESQIISHEVYETVAQEKFIPIVAEFHATGRPFLPTFLQSRIYLDFSSPQTLEDNYDKLLRNIFGKPLYKRPPLGDPPSFLLGDEAGEDRTGAKVRRVRRDAERNEKSLPGSFADYADAVLDVIRTERLQKDAINTGVLDELVMESIDRFRPYRNQWRDTVRYLSRYGAIEAVRDRVHGSLEKATGLLGWPPNVSAWAEVWGDNVSFLVRELFLVTASALLEEEEYETLGFLLSHPYFVRERREGRGYRGFSVFDTYQQSLDEIRKRRLKLNRLSVVADLTKSRAVAAGEDFDQVIETELLLFVRSILDEFTAEYGALTRTYWYPRTLVYRDRFAHWEYTERLRSRAFFERFKPVLGVESLEQLGNVVAAIPETPPIVNIGFTRLTAQGAISILDVAHIATLP